MDVREKLVELIEKASYECDEGTRDLWDMRQIADGIADFLIANGITVQDNTEISDEILEQLRNAPVTVMTEEPTIEVVQEWISVKDRLPESEKDAVMIALRWGAVDIGWCEEGRWGSEFVNEYDDGEVTHWMPLPQPPKGD